MLLFRFREPTKRKPLATQEPDPLASPVDDIIEGQENRELEALILLALLAQYGSTNVRRILRESGATSATSPDLLTPLVEENTDPLIESLDAAEMQRLLSAIGLLGFENGELQGNRELTRVESLEIQGEIDQNIRTRILSLLGVDRPRDVVGQDIENMAVPQGLDVTSYAVIAALIIEAIRQAEIEGRPTQSRVEEIYRGLIESRAESRAKLIADDNTATIFGNANFLTVAAFNPLTKTWLRTTSANPRPEHLAQVGVTVPFNATFPSGEFWSQEVIGCNCGISVGF